jgi:PhzF family phenazine biosynthesis protein
MKYPIYQIDAFTETLFGGNPAAVCPLREWLPDHVMQCIAAENNLAETAFFTGSEGEYHIRWFTPEVEVDLCGHATLAAAHVIFKHLNYSGDSLSFTSRSGILKVKKDGDWLTLDFPADRAVPSPDRLNLDKALGVSSGKVFKGRSDLMVVLGSQEEVEDLRPDFRLLSEIGVRGVIVTAPGKNAHFVSRFFAPAVGINEDPVTGSAHTTLIPYWSEATGLTELTAYQISQRGGHLRCRYLGDRVEISGRARTYLTGEIFLDTVTSDTIQ